jgi:hypothetical protein
VVVVDIQRRGDQLLSGQSEIYASDATFPIADAEPVAQNKRQITKRLRRPTGTSSEEPSSTKGLFT